MATRHHGSQQFVSRHFRRTSRGVYIPSGGGDVAAVWFDEDFTAHGLSDATNYHGQTVDGQVPDVSGTWSDIGTTTYKAYTAGNANGINAGGTGYTNKLHAVDAGAAVKGIAWSGTLDFDLTSSTLARWKGFGFGAGSNYAFAGVRSNAADALPCVYVISDTDGARAHNPGTGNGATGTVTIAYDGIDTLTATIGVDVATLTLSANDLGDITSQLAGIMDQRAGDNGNAVWTAGTVGPT